MPDASDGMRLAAGVRGIGRYESVFKYISLEGSRSWNMLEETLTNNKLIGSTKNALNDPFELSPCLIDDLDPETIKSCFEFETEAGFHNAAASSEAPFEDVNLWSDRATKTIERTIETARVVSFCDKVDSPLLWSHYANSHRGAVLHFVGKAFLGTQTQGFVNYSRQRPSLPLSAALRFSNRDAERMKAEEYLIMRGATLGPLIFTKPEDWSYEGEFRLAYSTTRKTHVTFDPNGLVEIIVGARTEAPDVARIRQLVASTSRPNLKLSRARISNRTFSVEIETEPAQS